MADARADVELVRRGLARSRRHAAELVAAGRVTADDRIVTKPSTPVSTDEILDVTPDPADPAYASRAGGKLAAALAALAADPIGRTVPDAVDGAWCLDLGASTGGFTDVLLRRGAAHVVSLDVGHDQLVPALRGDERVTVIERFNVRDLTARDLERAPDLVVGDLSFISLTLVLPVIAGVLPTGAPALMLIKPQFEVGRERLGSGGVVRDPQLHVDAILSVVDAASPHRLAAHAIVPSPLPGPSGNREYFCWFMRAPVVHEARAEVAAAVAHAVAWTLPDGGSVLPPVVHLNSAPTSRGAP